VDGPVAEEPEIAREERRVVAQDLREMRGAGLLLPLQKELQVDGGRDAGGAYRVERREQADDGRLVVARRPGVEHPSRIDRSRGRRDVLPSRLHGAVALARLPRLAGPLRGVNRLAVIVRVKDDGPPGARRG